MANIWPDFFGWKISHFWSVLEFLSVVFNFLLSSPTKIYEDSDSESESFQKISSEKFERRQGQPRGDENHEFYEKIDFAEIPWRANRAREIDFLSVSDPKIHRGPCAARNVQNFGFTTCTAHAW